MFHFLVKEIRQLPWVEKRAVSFRYGSFFYAGGWPIGLSFS